MIAITCTYNGCQRAVHSQQMCIFHVKMHWMNIQMELDDYILRNIFEVVNFNNWEALFTLSHVCKSWRRITSPHLSHIGVVAMNGEADRKLNVN